MLREIAISAKQDGGYTRRWYQDERMDLFVWFDAGGRIVRFQLAYDKLRFEHAIDWKIERGFVHSRVDDGAGLSPHPGSPLMIDGGVFAKQRVIAEFRRCSAAIDPGVSAFVLARLGRYSRRATVADSKKALLLVSGIVGGLLAAWLITR